MSQISMNQDGAISIPPELRERHGFTAETPIRVVETRSGILLIPLTRAPMSPALQEELADWQALSTSTWEAYPYEENLQ